MQQHPYLRTYHRHHTQAIRAMQAINDKILQSATIALWCAMVIVGISAAVDEKVKIVATAASVLSEKACVVGLVDGHLEVAVLIVELSPDVDVPGPGAHGSAGHKTSLYKRVGVVTHDFAILNHVIFNLMITIFDGRSHLAGSRLAFVSVDHQILGSAGARLVHEAPLHAGGETGPATASQSTGLDLVDDPV